MRNRGKYGFVLGLYLPLFCLCMLVGGCRFDSRELPELISFDSLRSGDLVFRRGSSAASVIVNAVDSKGVYTHIGVVLFQDSVAMVVHSVPDEAPSGEPDRVKIERLEEFFRGMKALSGAFYRVESLSDKESRGAADEAMRWYRKGVEFDSDFVMDDTTALYCTELVELSFRKVGYDLSRGHTTQVDAGFFEGEYIFPSDVLLNEDLRLLYSY